MLALWREQSYQLPIGSLAQPEVNLLAIEADELWSFVGNKSVQQWVWLAIERRTGLVLGFYIGDRSEQSAQCLWWSTELVVRTKALFFTDDWDAYGCVIPAGQQVRKTLSFSKSLENHYQAILFFLRHHNLEILARNPSL